MNNIMSKDNSQNELNTKNVIKRYEIAVYDLSYNEMTGKDEYQRVSYSQPVIIEASSPEELQKKLLIYKQCGQFAKVINELPSIVTTSETTTANTTTTINTNTCDQQNTDVQKKLNNTTIQISNNEKTISNKNQIKYYKIGDIEIKDDNGKIYQKQWVKLSENESSNIRIINSKNNSIVQLVNKHIEIKKWVIVENQQTNDLNIGEYL